MILGVGIDVCAISRMEQAIGRHGGRLEERVFTEGERAYCRGRGVPAQHFAARFAAKEALLKALGVPEGLSWHELEIVNEDGGAPALRLHGRAAAAARARGVEAVHVSLTHGGDVAAAVVITEGRFP